MTPVDLLFENPVAVLALALVLRAGLAWQRSLTWPEYRTLHGIKRLLFPVLQRRRPFGFAEFVNEKGARSDPEFVTTEHGGVKDVVGLCRDAGGSLHLLSSIKRRPPEHGDKLSMAHVVWTHDDGTQTECYVFRNSDGTTDVYTHHETSVSDPDGHLSDLQTDGDPRGVVRAALGLD
jgi:hypothetical protein